MWWANDKILETKTVSFFNKNKTSALFYTISSNMNKCECPSMCYMPTYQVFLFNSSLFMKTRGVQNNVAGVTLKNYILYVHFIIFIYQ